MADPDRKLERDLQVDPMLREGRSSRSWIWMVGIAILIALALTFWATTDSEQRAQAPNIEQAPPVTTGSAVEQEAPGLPGGRGTSAVPPAGQNTETVR